MELVVWTRMVNRMPARLKSAALFLVLAGFVSGSFLFAQQARPDALQLWRQGQFQAAIDVTLQEIQENPRNLDAYTVLGWSLLDSGRFPEARDFALQALEVARYDYRIIGILGTALFQLGQNQQALRYFQEYVQLQPQGSRVDQVYYFMGEIFIRFGEFHHADISLSAAVHHNPRLAAWWLRLGFARERAGNSSGAQAAYRQVLVLQPGNTEASQGLLRLDSQ